MYNNPLDDRPYVPSYFPQNPMGRGKRRRRDSSGSEQSTTSSRSHSPEPDSQFLLSMGNTPVVENAPVLPLALRGGTASLTSGGVAPNDMRPASDGIISTS